MHHDKIISDLLGIKNVTDAHEYFAKKMSKIAVQNFAGNVKTCIITQGSEFMFES
jgi:hypothetical protein